MNTVNLRCIQQKADTDDKEDWNWFFSCNGFSDRKQAERTNLSAAGSVCERTVCRGVEGAPVCPPLSPSFSLSLSPFSLLVHAIHFPLCLSAIKSCFASLCLALRQESFPVTLRIRTCPDRTDLRSITRKVAAQIVTQVWNQKGPALTRLQINLRDSPTTVTGFCQLAKQP